MSGLQRGVATAARILPQLVSFVVILVVGYLAARLISRLTARLLERVGFDRAVERGGVRRALQNTQYDPSDLLAKLVFYAIMLFVLQLAFGVFGDNPISDLLFGIIAFLPLVFVAVVIVVVAAAIAAGVREIVRAALGGLSYGRLLADVASGVILAIGLFAALNQLRIAPAIVNGLFYALLAIVVGVTIVAVGGGGIAPMRDRWQRALDRIDDEAPRIREKAQSAREEAQSAREQIAERAQERAAQARDIAEEEPEEDEGAYRLPYERGGTRTVRLPSEDETWRR
ncbi:MAG: hypothetical protein KY434_04745 [Actinobacteria bacterium]|nr:hypothetical protein [Actinomycetota bacterium]